MRSVSDNAKGGALSVVDMVLLTPGRPKERKGGKLLWFEKLPQGNCNVACFHLMKFHMSGLPITSPCS